MHSTILNNLLTFLFHPSKYLQKNAGNALLITIPNNSLTTYLILNAPTKHPGTEKKDFQ